MVSLATASFPAATTCNAARRNKPFLTLAAAGPGRRGRSRSASAGPSTAAAAAAAASDSDSDGAAADGAVPGGGDDEEDLRSLDVLLDSVVPPEDFPQAAVPGAVVAHPKPFQLQASAPRRTACSSR